MIDLPLGPFVTTGLWLLVVLAIELGDRRAARQRRLPWIEIGTFVATLVMLQLLLDLHTPHLGDAVVAGIHAVVLAIAWLRR